jgi:hypothetical protein
MTDPKRPRIEQDPEDWQAGYEAGLAGGPRKPHPRAGTLGFASGLIEGQADRAKPPEERKPHTRPPKGP